MEEGKTRELTIEQVRRLTPVLYGLREERSAQLQFLDGLMAISPKERDDVIMLITDVIYRYVQATLDQMGKGQ
jgi:hypothetical protein